MLNKHWISCQWESEGHGYNKLWFFENIKKLLWRQKYELVLCLTTNNESNVENIKRRRRVRYPGDSAGKVLAV